FLLNVGLVGLLFTIVNHSVRRLSHENRRYDILRKCTGRDDDVRFAIIVLRRIRRLKMDLCYPGDLDWLLLEITEACRSRALHRGRRGQLETGDWFAAGAHAVNQQDSMGREIEFRMCP